MKSIFLLSFLVVFCISSCATKDLIVGTSYNARLLWQQKAEYSAIPFKKRVKELFFSDPGLNIFKGIIARDLDHSESLATITSGGVGFSYVNIRFKSERGGSLNYQIEIYV